MKNLIIGFGTIMMSVLTIMVIAALNINTINKLDLETATRMAVYQTLEERYDTSVIPVIRVKHADGSYKKPNEKSSNEYTDGTYVYKDYKNPNYTDYGIQDDNDLRTMFNENLSMLLKKQDHVTVKFIASDYLNGLLSVNVSYTYNNMGIKRTINTTQTVIREEGVYSNVNFDDEDISKIYSTVYKTLDGSGYELVFSLDANPYPSSQVYMPSKEITSDDIRPWSSYIQNIKKVSILDNIKPATIESWFYGGENITEIVGLENLDTSSCQSFRHVFENCKSLTNLSGIQNWNTSKVEAYSSMFKNSGISDLSIITNWNVSKAIYFDNMFNGTKISDLSKIQNWKFNGNNVRINGMFMNCTNITNVNSLSNWDVKNIYTISDLFSGCTNLSNIDGIKNWNISNCRYISGLLKNTAITNTTAISNWNLTEISSLSELFANCTKLTDISTLTNWKDKVSSVSDFSKVFYNTGITNINSIESWNISNATSMNAMFAKSKITDLSKLTTWSSKVSKVTDFNEMFAECNISNLSGLSNWNISSATTLYKMFYKCSNITSLTPLKNWNVKNVKTFTSMFEDCSGLVSLIDIANWSFTSSTKNFTKMFSGCSRLSNESVSYISKWKTNGVTSSDIKLEMFSGSITNPL